MKKLLIRLLFRLVIGKDETYSSVNDKAIKEWFKLQKGKRGPYEYFKKRDLMILKTLGLGLDTKQYYVYLGRRLELLNFINELKNGSKNKNKKGS